MRKSAFPPTGFVLPALILIVAPTLAAQQTGLAAAGVLATENRVREDSFFANSVDTGTGAFIYERTLLSVQGARSLVFDMACNSTLTMGEGPLGLGCSHPYEVRVDGDPEGVVTVHWDGNRRNNFRFAGPGNDYEPLEITVLYDRLRRDGQGWELTLIDGTVYEFDAVGNLQTIANKIGQELEMGYSDGTLTAVIEPVASKRISLRYRQDGSGLLQHLQDAENRIVFFNYDAQGRLSEIRDPARRGLNSFGRSFQALQIPDDTPAGVERAIDVDRSTEIGLVVLDALQMNHQRPTDLRVRIQSPAGTVVELTTERVLPGWDLGNVVLDQFEGEDPEGTWRITAADLVPGETGTLNTARLVFTDVTNVYQLSRNAAGQITRITGPEGGRIVANRYDSAGRLVEQDDGVDTNETATFSYRETPQGVTTTYQDRTGAVSILEHDRDYNLLTETDPFGNTKSFQYDSLGNRTVITDPLQRSWTYAYDSDGNVISVQDPLGNATTFQYDNRNNLTAIRDPLGRESKFTYNSSNNLTRTTDTLPFGHEDTRSYSGSSQLTGALLDDGGGVTFGYQGGMPNRFGHPVSGNSSATYDRVGRIRSMTDGDGKTIRLTYDDRDLVVQREDQLGNISRFEYDSRGRRIRETDPRGNVTLFEYDGNDRLTTVTNALGETMQFEYDGEGRIVRQIDPLGNVDTTVYDENGRVIAEIDPLGNEERVEYDAAGQKIAEFDAAGVMTESYVFDERGLPLMVRDALGATVEFEYDAVERPTMFRDQLGDETFFEYDALDRPTGSTDPLGRETSRSYLEDDVTRRLEDDRGNGVTFGYDPANRMVREQQPWGPSTRFQYNDRDLVTRVSKPSGRVLNIGYNNAGGVSFMNKTGGPRPEPDVFLSYDDSGNLIEVETKLASETQRRPDSTYEYDALDRISRFTNVHGDTIEYAYDDAGNLNELTYPDGEVVKYTHDGAGRVTQVEDWANRITSYAYDENGQITTIVFPNGTRRVMEYDKKGQVTRRADLGPGGSAIVDFRYTYDARGQIQLESSGVRRAPFRPQPVMMTYRQTDNRIATFNGQSVQYDSDGQRDQWPSGGPVRAVRVRRRRKHGPRGRLVLPL